MTEPLLDEDLRRLLDLERAAPLRDDLPLIKARSRARVLDRIRGGGGGGAGTPGKGWSGPAVAGIAGAALVVGAVMGGAVVGAAAIGLWPSSAPMPVPVTVVVPVPQRVEVPVPVPVVGPAPEPPPSPTPNVDERATIDRARVALLRGDAGEALVTLMGHERRYPEGTLAEERDVLSIEALVALGRRTEAVERAAAFRQRYPSSVHLPALDGL